MNKYIDADKLKDKIERQQRRLMVLSSKGQVNMKRDCALQNGVYVYVLDVIDSLQQEQPEFVNEIWHKVSEEANLTRPVVLSDGDKYMSPPTTFPFKDMSGFVRAMNKKYKADYTIWAYMDDLLNITAHQREQPEPSCKSCGFYENNCPFIRGKFIPYPNKVCKDYTYSVMQEQPEVDLEKELEEYFSGWADSPDYGQALNSDGECVSTDEAIALARHFYGLRNRALEKAARHIYESWMGGAMDDVRRDMVELGKVLNARKEK